ncbi:multidrug effflux MFS transporter [Paenibacillus campinasensis]|uniref:Bcr/CflA family efflux transporter n=1 Tax=Paenibacillus campinasensis TaxID=66347 RepID=A0A268EYG1_9BACL|nr:multidrug effflux MFS transporter [Paenibacillus campinasensis]MUG65320.1 Bcr/CflA family efflux MFS transporter [Paenibacillus campinasensis]PAD78165.1 MFS transporter [Paenibacillus campinasensis]
MEPTIITNKEALPAPKQRKLWIVFLLGSLSAFGPLSLDMYLPALPKLADDLNTTVSLAQMSLTACMLGLALGQLLAGPLSDVKGRRGPLLVGLMVYTVTSVLCVFTSSIWVFLLLRFIQGLAGAAGIVLSRAMARDMYEGTELTKFFSMLMLVNGAAPILAPILGAQVLLFADWPIVFIVLGVYGLLMLVCVFAGLKETLSPERRSTGGIQATLKTFGNLMKDRVFMGYALTQGFIMAGMFAYISGSPFVLQDIYGVSPQMFSLIFALNALGIIAAAQVTGRLAGRVDEAKMFPAGVTLATIGGVLLLGALAVGGELYLVLPPLFLAIASAGIVSTSGMALALRNHGHNAGSASALLGLLTFIIGGMAAPLVGLGGKSTALPLGIVIAACELGAVLCYLGMVRRKR